MPIYTIIEEEIKESGEWISVIVVVAGDEGNQAQLHMKGDGRISPPPATEMFWVIEHSEDKGQTWIELDSHTIQDSSGVFFSDPISLGPFSIPLLENNQVRSRIITDSTFRFGADLEVN